MFADDLKEQLKANHMSQGDLAEYLGVKQSSISHWLNGRTKPNDRNFDMIVELFELKREHYTAERAGVIVKKEEPKVVGEFHPKPYVRPEVKEKVDLSENPYKKAKEKEEPFRCDMEIKKVKDDLESLNEKFRVFVMQVGNATETLTELIDKKDKEIEELEEKITYLRGLIDGAKIDKPEIEGKSWWQRLWS